MDENNYWQRLWNAFKSGKMTVRKPDLYQDVREIPLDEMLERLLALPEDGWMNYVFARDPMNGRLQEDERRQIFREACENGRKTAVNVLERYGTNDAVKLGKTLSVNVMRSEADRNSDARVVFARFEEPDTVTVYMGNVRRTAALLQESAWERCRENADVFGYLLAHELYHVLVYRKSSDLGGNRPEADGKNKKRGRKLRITEEIEAMSFAQHFTGMTISPYILDVVLLYSCTPKGAACLYEEIINGAGI